MTAASTEIAETVKVVSSRALLNGATIEIREKQRARGIKAEFQAVYTALGGTTVSLTPPIATHVAASLRDAFIDALRVEGFPLERQPLEYLATAYERTFDTASPTDAIVAVVLRGLGRAIETSNHELIGRLARLCLDTANEKGQDSRGAAEDLTRQHGRHNFAAKRLLALAGAILEPEAKRVAKEQWRGHLKSLAALETTHGEFTWPPPYATHHVLLAEKLVDFIAQIVPSRLPSPIASSRKWATVILAVRLRDDPPKNKHLLAVAALKAIGFGAKEAGAFAASGTPAKKRPRDTTRK